MRRRAAAAAVVLLAIVAVLLATVQCGERRDDADRAVAVKPADDSPAAAAPRPPDVLLLVMDTVRADRCSFVGYARRTTPHLEEFARESVVFTDAWSPSPWTLPAHTALFTGRHPEPLGVVGATQRPIPSDVPTLAGLVGARGYATGCFTNNAWIAEHTGLSRGFHHVDRVYEDAAGPTARAAHARALRWMQDRRRDGKPFFAFINDVEPHMPRTPPEEFERRFLAAGTLDTVRDAARTVANERLVMMGLGLEPYDAALVGALSDLYDAEIAQLDDEVGSLLGRMRASGLLDGTLVIVLSDHGEGLGDHRWIDHGVFLDRELLRVPLLVRPPHGGPARTVADVVRIEDVFAEVLAQCGIPAPAGVTGMPLLGDTSGRVALASERAPENICDKLAGMHGDKQAEVLRTWRRSAYDGRYHLLLDDRGGVALFDVRDDPRETRDVAAAHPDVVASLRARIAAVPPRPR